MSTPDWKSGLHGGYLGCFKDDEDRAIPDVHFISDVAMSVDFCLDVCAVSNGFCVVSIVFCVLSSFCCVVSVFSKL